LKLLSHGYLHIFAVYFVFTLNKPQERQHLPK
jgi:hypothetical protein